MASETKKPRMESELVTKVGYLHNVSSLKTNSAGTCTYFIAYLQHGRDAFQRIVNFHIKLQRTFVDAEKKKSAVKLSNCVLTTSQEKDSTHALKFFHKSTISLIEDNLGFDCRQPLDVVEEKEVKEVPIKDFFTLSSNEKGTIKAKVITTIIEEEKITTRFGKRTMSKVLLGDETGTIACCLWENKRLEVTKGKSYEFTNLNLNQFMGNQYASTSMSSQIKPIEDLEATFEDDNDQVEGPIQAVEVTKSTKCSSCYSSVTLTSGQRTVKCFRCRKRCVTESLFIDLKCTMKILIKESMKEFVVPATTLKDVLAKLGVDTLNTDSMEEQLLIGGPYKFSVQGNDLIKIDILTPPNPRRA